jgi:hypothetical protein
MRLHLLRANESSFALALWKYKLEADEHMPTVENTTFNSNKTLHRTLGISNAAWAQASGGLAVYLVPFDK